MAYLPSSGDLSMSAINTVFARGTDLNSYRGTAWYTAAGGSGTFASSNISFNDFYNKGPSAATTVNIDDLTGTWQSYYSGGGSQGSTVVTLTFDTNGALQMNSTGTTELLFNEGNATTWASPLASGVGSGYWINWTLIGTLGTGGSATATSGRVQLSTARAIIVSKSTSGGNFFDAEYDIEIWDAASGGTRVGHAPGTAITALKIPPP